MSVVSNSTKEPPSQAPHAGSPGRKLEATSEEFQIKDSNTERRKLYQLVLNFFEKGHKWENILA